MGYVNCSEADGLLFSHGFWESLIIRKARQKFFCPICNKTRGSGTRYVSEPRYYKKICMFCFEEWSEKSLGTLNLIIEKIKYNQQIYKKNKDIWSKESLAGVVFKDNTKAWWEK